LSTILATLAAVTTTTTTASGTVKGRQTPPSIQEAEEKRLREQDKTIEYNAVPG